MGLGCLHVTFFPGAPPRLWQYLVAGKWTQDWLSGDNKSIQDQRTTTVTDMATAPRMQGGKGFASAIIATGRTLG